MEISLAQKEVDKTEKKLKTLKIIFLSLKFFLLFIISQEDDIVTRANTRVQTLIETIHAGEIKRNRTRVDEINTLLDHYRDEVENFENNLGV